jgi:low affinity Fe/Cu permease
MTHWYAKHRATMSWGDRVAERVSGIFCSFPGFIAACLVVIGWAISGPFFHFSDTWQLVINTGTTIVTFLMAFLIGANGVRQAERARIEAVEELNTNLTAKAEIEDMQKAFERLDNKLDAILAALSTAPAEEPEAAR